MSTLLVIYSILAVGLVLSLFKSRQKTLKAFKVAGKAALKLAPSLIAIVVSGYVIEYLMRDPVSHRWLASVVEEKAVTKMRG